MKIMGYLVLALALVLVGYSIPLWRGYIDVSVTEGEGYGLVIGDSKREAFDRVAKAVKVMENGNGRAFTQVEVSQDSTSIFGTTPGRIVMVEAVLDESAYPLYVSRNRWEFYFGGSYFNRLSLIFCENRLCEIYRHRKQFELP